MEEYTTRITPRNPSHNRLANLTFDYAGLGISVVTGAGVVVVSATYPLSQIDKFISITIGTVGVVGLPIVSSLSNLDIVSLQNYPRDDPLSEQPNSQYAIGQGARNLFSVWTTYCWVEGIKNSDSTELLGALILTVTTAAYQFSVRNRGKKRLEAVILKAT